MDEQALFAIVFKWAAWSASSGTAPRSRPRMDVTNDICAVRQARTLTVDYVPGVCVLHISLVGGQRRMSPSYAKDVIARTDSPIRASRRTYADEVNTSSSTRRNARQTRRPPQDRGVLVAVDGHSVPRGRSEWSSRNSFFAAQSPHGLGIAYGYAYLLVPPGGRPPARRITYGLCDPQPQSNYDAAVPCAGDDMMRSARMSSLIEPRRWNVEVPVVAKPVESPPLASDVSGSACVPRESAR